MIGTSESILKSVVVHHVGNQAADGVLHVSDDFLSVANEHTEELLRTYFLSHFSSPENFAFTAPGSDFSRNTICRLASAIFDDPDSLVDHSGAMASHLFAISTHPQIKAGDLFVAYITGVLYENELVDAVGIFKSETKEAFLKLKQVKKNFDLTSDQGINVLKLDKGCLVLNIHREEGYKVCVVDNTNRVDAHFWKNDFLNVKPVADAFHHTQNFMSLTSQYVSEQLDEEFSVSKADQIDLLNRSADFFKKKEQFSQNEFETEVLGDADVIESFRKFGKDYAATHEIDLEKSFEISAPAVKRQMRVFKSVLKLDQNFHIYIHGGRELIEKGFDEVTGRNYYKIFFEKES